MSFEKPPGSEGSWIGTGSPPISTGLSTMPRGAAVTSALRLLVRAADCPSITITVQDTSGAYCADLATLQLEGYEMTLKHSTGERLTSVTLQRTTSSER